VKGRNLPKELSPNWIQERNLKSLKFTNN
jgi:hypothetical protein